MPRPASKVESLKSSAVINVTEKVLGCPEALSTQFYSCAGLLCGIKKKKKEKQSHHDDLAQ